MKKISEMPQSSCRTNSALCVHLRHLYSTIASKLVFRTQMFDTGHQVRADLLLAVPCGFGPINLPTTWLATDRRQDGSLHGDITCLAERKRISRLTHDYVITHY